MELVLAENKIAQLIFTELVRDERIPDYALWDIYLGKYPKQLLEALARAGKFKFMESLASRNITIMIPEGETRATYKAPWEIAWQTADLTPVVEAVQSGNLDAQTLLSDIEHRSWLIGDNPTLPIR